MPLAQAPAGASEEALLEALPSPEQILECFLSFPPHCDSSPQSSEVGASLLPCEMGNGRQER